MSPLSLLFDKCNAIQPLADDVKEAMENAFEVLYVPKHTILLRPGEVCNYMYLVLKGLVRVYYDVDGREITSRLMSEGLFITSYISYFTRKPGNEFIETYEDSLLAAVTVEKAQQIYRQFPAFNYTVRVLTEYSFFLSEERTVALRNTTAENRFLFFMQRHPDLITRVASRHIASYLGMTEETYSRVKRKILHKEN
jgi:CRP/FNR family transcriptional regulator, anaerobic regulatory protein